MTRLALYARIAQRMAALGLLLSFWGVMLASFAAHMLPRLRYLAGAPVGTDAPCGKPECDFSIFWPAGQLARAHSFAQLYDAGAFPRLAAQMLGTQARLEPFLYPPPMLLPAAAISHLPFEQAAFVWTAIMLAAAAAVLRLAGLSWLVIVIGLLSPAALLDTELGQIGVLGGALLVAGLLLAQRRPGIGGGLLGLLAVKPQIALLLPVVFVVRRSRGAAAACALVVVALALLSTLLFGPAVWSAFFTADHAAGVLNAPFAVSTYQGWGVSVFWLARGLGAGLKLAFLAQGLTSLGAIAALVIAARRGLDAWPFAALAVYLSLLATPYGFTYDMVAYSLVLAESLRRRRWRLDLLDALLFLWPGLCFAVSQDVGVPLTPLFVVVAATRAALRARPAVLPGPAQE